MSTKDVHAKCVVCGGLVHIGHDGEMAVRAQSPALEDHAYPREEVAIHSCCRRLSSPYNRRHGGIRRADDRFNAELERQGREKRYELDGRMMDLRNATPRRRRQLLREWFG